MELTHSALGMMLLIGFAAACGLMLGLRLLLIETRKPYAMNSTIEAATFGVVFVVCSGFMLYLVALVTVGHADLHAPMSLHWPAHAANAIHAGCYTIHGTARDVARTDSAMALAHATRCTLGAAMTLPLAKHEMHVVPAVRHSMHGMEHYWRRVDTGE